MPADALSGIFPNSRMTFSRCVRTRLLSTLVPLLVLVALCFSIGEGLRLTPFPVSTLTIDQESDRQFAVKASQEISLYKYGPLDVPTQTQKRNKRHTVEFVCPPSGIIRKLPTRVNNGCDLQGSHVVSARFVTRLAGRDPPSPSWLFFN